MPQHQTCVVDSEPAGAVVALLATVHRVHDGQVMLVVARLDARIREAMAHAHDREEPGA